VGEPRHSKSLDKGMAQAETKRITELSEFLKRFGVVVKREWLLHVPGETEVGRQHASRTASRSRSRSIWRFFSHLQVS